MAACCLAVVRPAVAQPPADRDPLPFPNPLSALDRNVVEAFGWPNLLWHDGAVAVTAAMAFSGADHEVRLKFQRLHPLGDAYAKSAYWGGYFVPTALSAALYTIGAATKHRDLAGAGSAALQAIAVTAFDTAFLKWATGRPFPMHGGPPDDPARLTRSYSTEFGEESFSTRGYLAWPSGHTSTATAVAAALSAYYPEHVWIPLIGYPIAILIGVGMIEGDHHWASDVVGGAMIGHAIGYTTGRNLRAYRSRHGRMGAVPWIRSLSGARGLCLGYDF